VISDYEPGTLLLLVQKIPIFLQTTEDIEDTPGKEKIGNLKAGRE
jgi:hypothetical protein